VSIPTSTGTSGATLYYDPTNTINSMSQLSTVVSEALKESGLAGMTLGETLIKEFQYVNFVFDTTNIFYLLKVSDTIYKSKNKSDVYILHSGNKTLLKRIDFECNCDSIVGKASN
jgi:hypothetical protein